jgi:hypothetical protein
MSHSTAIPNNALETPGELYLDGGYAERNPDWHQGDSPWKAEQILKMMGEMGMQPKSICEIGCGAGEILAILQKSKPECTFAGYEIAPQAFQIAATKSNGNLKFHQELRPEAGEHFDVMLIIDVVEHVDDCCRRPLPLSCTFRWICRFSQFFASGRFSSGARMLATSTILRSPPRWPPWKTRASTCSDASTPTSTNFARNPNH